MSKPVIDHGAQATLGSTDIAIIALAMLAAGIHFSRALANPHISILFTLNGLGYLGLVALIYLPMFERRRGLVVRILMFYAALTITLYIVWGFMKGDWPLIGFICATAEFLLIRFLRLRFVPSGSPSQHRS